MMADSVATVEAGPGVEGGLASNDTKLAAAVTTAARVPVVPVSDEI